MRVARRPPTRPIPLSHHDSLRAHIFSNHGGAAALADHCDDFPEIGVQFVERLALAVGAGKAGDITDIEPGIRASFDDCGIGLHGRDRPLRMCRQSRLGRRLPKAGMRRHRWRGFTALPLALR